MTAPSPNSKPSAKLPLSLRVLDGAVVPFAPSTTYAMGTYPRKFMVLFFDAILGVGIGMALARAIGITLTPTALLLIPALFAGLYIAGQYDEYHPRELSTAVGSYAVVAAVLGAMAVLLNATGRLEVDTRSIVLISAIVPAVILVWRLSFRIVATHAIEGTPVILVGTGEPLQEGWRCVRQAPHFDVVGVIDSANPDSWIVGIEERLVKRPVRNTLVVVGVPQALTDDQSAALVRLRRLGADVVSVAQLIEEAEERLPIGLIRGDALESWASVQQSGHEVSLRAKRVIDLAGAMVLSIALGLPALIGALATKLSDGGPVLYRQRRVGRNGHHFDIYKIRSMIVGAERRSGAVWSASNDPRITPLGQLLRQSRLDEVPQLWNVLRGDMSLVGPRPERPEFTDTLAEQIPLYDSRHIIKPGLTGWAQVKLPYGASVNDALAKLEYDLYYIRHWSVWFDMRVLLKTVGVVLFRRGGR